MFASKFILPFWVGFLGIATLKFISSLGNANVGCLESERQALVNFKLGLKDPTNRLSSWVGENCCRWTGIRCDNKTGHVESLTLRNSYHRQFPLRKFIQMVMHRELVPEFKRSCISGEINPSLVELKYLKQLDLSLNCFGGIGIPNFIGSFNRLRYLNLSRAGFGGRVPHELGNLTSLRYLDLNHQLFLRAYASDDLNCPIFLPNYNLRVNSLHWLSRLSSLQHLDMGGVNLSMATDWLVSINMLPSILHLQLRNCSLVSIPTSLPHVNFSSLSTLDLSYNMLGPKIPTWLFNVSGMMSLKFGSNYFGDFVPTALGNLCKLQTLELWSNSFTGEIIKFKECFIGCIRNSLEELDLGSNELNGHLPDWFGQFTNLKSLDLSDNSISGSIPPSFGRLLSLRKLYLSRNSLSGMVPSSLGGLSSLEELDLSNNELNGSISESLGQLSDLVSLDVSNNSFNSVFSETHFSKLKKLKYLWLSSTSITFNVCSSWVPPFKLLGIEMNDCKLGPKFPAWLQTQNELHFLSLSSASILDAFPNFLWKLSPNIYHIALSNNTLSGSISRSIGEKTTNLISLSLHSNRLKGSIPLSLCKMKYLANLFLHDNHLTGEIPQCLGDLQYLVAMNLGNNSLSGVVPTSIGHLSRLRSLHLNKNKLSGELPPTMKNCKELVTLDLGENGFSGKIPNWIGEELSSLKFLFLQSNKFDGSLPPQLSLLSELQVLDLARNNISGTIPTCFGNFTAMAIINRTNKITTNVESIVVYSKGFQLKYSSLMSLVVNINLSGNDLCGEIPQEITHLSGLQSLNLSKNHLTGKIPKNISGLRQMESLDLSGNRLSGAIPDSLPELTFLVLLNLSYNNLSGRIPRGNQLDTIIDTSIAWGNPFLCGLPLLNQCPENETSHDSESVVHEEESNDEFLMHLFYISMVFGFIVGFWVVCGILIFKRTWRIAYYQFFDDMGDLFYVKVARYVAKLQKAKNELVGNEGQ